MTIRFRTVFLIIMGLVFLWFLYIERAILTPFVVAAIFAYICNPVVNLLSHKLKFSRGIAVAVIFIFIISLLIFSGIAITKQIFVESSDLQKFINHLLAQTKQEVNTLPDWLSQAVNETLVSIQKSDYLSSHSVLLFFPKALTRVVSFIIFFFASFYFLKEGRKILDSLLNFAPNDYKIEFEILLRKINSVLGGYLRGQLFLIFFVAFVLFIALSILGIRFALILAIFSGFAEIVPLIGPIVATCVAVIVAFVTNTANFSLDPIHAGIIIVIIYFILRHIQDYFITPFVMGKVTKLHPLIILFSVLSGGHLFGIFGLIIAVPTAAVIKILLEYSFNKVTDRELEKEKKVETVKVKA